MGTRHLTIVYVNGEYKVAQYGQWDGYPEGAGAIILDFLKNEFVEDKFRKNLAKLRTIRTDEEREALNTLYGKHFPPEFSRDTGARILKMIQDDAVRSGFLAKSLDFAADSLFCEWAYVIDLDKRMFEVYNGFNKEPLTKYDRFYFLRDQESEQKYTDNDGKKSIVYHGIKLCASWSLADLPDYETFLAACEE